MKEDIFALMYGRNAGRTDLQWNHTREWLKTAPAGQKMVIVMPGNRTAEILIKETSSYKGKSVDVMLIDDTMEKMSEIAKRALQEFLAKSNILESLKDMDFSKGGGIWPSGEFKPVHFGGFESVVRAKPKNIRDRIADELKELPSEPTT